MQRTEQMLSTHPRKPMKGETALTSCITACVECAAACTACADACLGEQKVQELVRCIRLNLDCADICEVTGRIIARQTETLPAVLRTQLEACAAACRACAEECEKHARMHEHCRICASACRECEEACIKMMETVSAAGVAH